MKSSEFIRRLKAMGVSFRAAKGSHMKATFNGVTTVVPNHGSKEINEWLRKAILKQLGIKE